MASEATIQVMETLLGADDSVTAEECGLVRSILGDGFVSPREAAAMVGHSVRWVYRRIEEKKIEPLYVGERAAFGYARQGCIRIPVKQLVPFIPVESAT